MCHSYHIFTAAVTEITSQDYRYQHRQLKVRFPQNNHQVTSLAFLPGTATDCGSQNICSLFSSMAGSRSLGESDTMSPLYSPPDRARSGFSWAVGCQCYPHGSEVSAVGCRMQAHCADVHFPSSGFCKSSADNDPGTKKNKSHQWLWEFLQKVANIL